MRACEAFRWAAEQMGLLFFLQLTENKQHFIKLKKQLGRVIISPLIHLHTHTLMS